MQKTLDEVYQLLDYCASFPTAILRYRSSDMILKAHSDASYLSVAGDRSRAGGHVYLGDKPELLMDHNGEILNT